MSLLMHLLGSFWLFSQHVFVYRLASTCLAFTFLSLFRDTYLLFIYVSLCFVISLRRSSFLSFLPSFLLSLRTPQTLNILKSPAG